MNRALSRYEFHTAVSLLYHFFWDDFCDWYIELVKDEISKSYAFTREAGDGGEALDAAEEREVPTVSRLKA